ncbi:hypothetical protein Tco_1367459 [Tanacetum coccineum]
MLRVRTSSRAMLAIYIAIHTYIVMSDLEDSTVTYMAVSIPFGGLSDIGSLGVDGPPVIPEDPYVYVKFMPPEDDVLPTKEQPLPAAVPTPLLESISYVLRSDPGGRIRRRMMMRILRRIQLIIPLIEMMMMRRKRSPSETRLDNEDDDRDMRKGVGSSTTAGRLCPPTRILPVHTSTQAISDAPPSGTPPILPIPLPTSSPSLLLPSTNHGADRPEVCLPPQKRLCFAINPSTRSESSSALATRPTGDTWDEMLEDMPGAPVTDETELGRRMTNFVTTRDRRAHAHTALIMEREARLSCEAWGRSRDASDLTRSEVMALRTQVVAQ